MGEVTLKVPAEYADDFRAAVVEELDSNISGIQKERKAVAVRLECNPDSGGADEDLRNNMAQMQDDIELAAAIGLHLSGAIELSTDNLGAVPHVFETMAQRIVGARLADALGVGPMDEDWVSKSVRPLIAELSWAVDRAAEFHGTYWMSKDREVA